MTRNTRLLLAALAASATLWACKDAWDGKAPPLEEHGDFEETGRFAPCGLASSSGGTTPACGSLESFDLSACNRGTLGQLSSDGIYGTLMRMDFSPDIDTDIPAAQRSFAGGLTLSTRDVPEDVSGYPLVEKQVNDTTFYATGVRHLTDGGTTLYAYAGCQADSAQHVVGCFQTCSQTGARKSQGTFDGVRLQRLDEPESSGGLQLRSESLVELGEPVDVYVAKKHAYVVSVNKTKNGPFGGLSVFDVSDKAHPKLTQTVSLNGDTYWNGVWAKDDALYVASANRGVQLFDISDPGHPVLVRDLPGEPMNVHTVFVDGDRLYAMSPSHDSVLIFDVSKPLRPVEMTRYLMPNDGEHLGYPHDAFAYDNRLYVNQMGQGYYVLDVTSPGAVKTLGMYTYDVDPYNPSHANAVGTFGGRTIAFEGGENVSAHLRVLDVTDPAHIVKIGEVKTRAQTSIHNMVLKDDRLYVAWYADGVRVFDVSVPPQPKQIAHYNTFRDSDPGRTAGLYVGAIGMRVPGDGSVYVVDLTRGLLIFDEP